MANFQKSSEVNLRGRVVMLSTLFEANLMSIIYASNIDQYNPPYHKRLILKNCTFGKKLDSAKSVIEEYHPDLFYKYNQLFVDLEEFKKFRNKLCHCNITWDTGKAASFNLWDWIEEDGFQFNVPKEYSLIDSKLFILKSIDKITPPLIELKNEIEHRLKTNYPEVYQILRPET